MLAGMGYELETQWRANNDVVTARDSEHYRAAMEMQAASRAAKQVEPRMSRVERVLSAVRRSTGTRTAQAVCGPRIDGQANPVR